MPLVVDRVTVRHHAAMPPVLNGLSFELAPSELLAVIGGNGSGKSTLARVLAGTLVPTSGSVRLVAGSGARRDSHDPLGRVGLVLQDPAAQSIAATVADDVAFGPAASGAPPDVVADIVHELLSAVGLRAAAAAAPHQLSGGQQQLLAIASVLACDVDVVVLDEPTAMLDPAARVALGAAVARLAAPRAVVWITQRSEELAACDRVAVLDAGELVWIGPVSAFVADPAIAATWSIDLPVASWAASTLAAAGGWPDGAAVPVQVSQLIGTLLPGAGQGTPRGA